MLDLTMIRILHRPWGSHKFSGRELNPGIAVMQEANLER